MSAIYEFKGGVITPNVHSEVLPVFIRANVAFPQIYGGMIIRTGRAAIDLMCAGELDAMDFSRSAVNDKQIADMTEAALLAHERAGISVPHIPEPDFDFIEMNDHAVTPLTLRSVFDRTKKGIMAAVHGHSIATLDIPENAPVNPQAEQLFMAQRLLEPEHRDKLKLLQTIWQTADNAMSGPGSADITATLHASLKDLPSERNERTYQIASAARVARTALNNLVTPALAEIEPHAYEVLGSKTAAKDVTSMFPLLAIYEAADELTDGDLEKLRNGATDLYHDEPYYL